MLYKGQLGQIDDFFQVFTWAKIFHWLVCFSQKLKFWNVVCRFSTVLPKNSMNGFASSITGSVGLIAGAKLSNRRQSLFQSFFLPRMFSKMENFSN